MQRYRRDDAALSPAYFANDGVSYVDVHDIEELKRTGSAEGTFSRYSLHESAASLLHSMVILQPHGLYAQPRKQRSRAKVFHIVDGEMVVVVFTEDGSVTARHHMAVDRILVVHIPPDTFHTNFAITPQAVYHELITGPFDGDSRDRVFADFAPPQADPERGRDYIRGLSAAIGPTDLVHDTRADAT